MDRYGQMDADKGTDGHRYGQTDRYGQMDTNTDRWTQIWTDRHR